MRITAVSACANKNRDDKPPLIAPSEHLHFIVMILIIKVIDRYSDLVAKAYLTIVVQEVLVSNEDVTIKLKIA